MERSYHIFYQLTSNAFPDLKAKILLNEPIGHYHFQSQGKTYIDGVDDAEEMRLTDEAFDILGFTDDEKLNIYKIVAAVMHLGNMHFKQRTRDEQAEADGTEAGEKVAHLMGISDADLFKGLLKPRIKVGSELVQKGQNRDQVMYAIGTLAKATYDRMFRWLVSRLNKTLDTNAKKQFFIGVLDIAGFEIFDFNSFEQICINFTNEKLQQYFNHHMFVLEQEEYEREGIQWTFIDFGLDLQPCIDLIEKPMGMFSILEEECMFPKATDQTFTQKMMDNHLGKSPNFLKPKAVKAGTTEANFGIKHYAGIVNYNTSFWIDKNKDPLNDTVCELFARSKGNPLLSELYYDKLGDDEETGGKVRRRKGSGFLTVSTIYREQLRRLMNALNATAPHFVRCIIPNESKEAGELDAPLVMHQLGCNGVLEGIRICRKGYPNRMLYADFKHRYQILAPNCVPDGFTDGKQIASSLLLALNWDVNDYKIGGTKIFFKAGVLGRLEELREVCITRVITLTQAQIRGYQGRAEYAKLKAQRLGMILIQRNVRKYIQCRNWPWWKLYTKVKPMLSIARQEDEMKRMQQHLDEMQLELAKEAKARNNYEDIIARLIAEKTVLYEQVQTDLEDISTIEERAAKLITQKLELEALLKEVEERLLEEEHGTLVLAEARKRAEAECIDLRGLLEVLERKLKKVENEKVIRDVQIRQMNEEFAKQEEAAAIASKAKRALEETLMRAQAELQKEEEKANQMAKAKAKMEAELDELEDNLERERKIRTDVEKARKKMEGDLKIAQEGIEEMERARKEVEESVRRKEKEMAQLHSQMEDDRGVIRQLQKKIKELQARIEELEEELEAERQARSKVEKQRAELARELEELHERLEEAGGATGAQLELNKRREAELAKLRRDLEEQAMQHEATVSSLRKKQNDIIAEMAEQIEQLQKIKAKLEREKHELTRDMDDLRLNMEHVAKAKQQAEKLAKSMENQLGEANSRLDESSRIINTLNAQQLKLNNDVSDLMRQLEEAEAQINQLNRAKASLQSSLEEARNSLEDESKAKLALQSQLRNAQHDIEQLREQAEEGEEARSQLLRQLAKVTNELQTLRARVEAEGLGGGGAEAEEIKRKLQAKLMEAEDQIDALKSKVASVDKQKHRLQNDLDDMSIEVERANAAASAAEKRQRNFDKTLAESKQKIDDIAAELEASQRECRTMSTEMFKSKTVNEELADGNEALKRENRSLADEMKDLTDQLGEEGRSMHDLDKARRKAMQEKEELQSALEEAEAALEQEESKVVRSQLELQQIRQEVDRRLAEKDDEFETTRRNHQRAVDSMQASLEAEAKGRAEAMKMKKKLENDIHELELSLDGANRQNADAQRNLKKQQEEIANLQAQIDDEQRVRDQLREQLAASERRCGALSTELEETRGALELSEHNRRGIESELNEANERVGDVQSQLTSASAAKRKLEGEMAAMQADLDETIREMKDADEKARTASADASRLAEELHREQEHANGCERARKSLEQQLKEMQVRLDEAEANVLKGGKKLISKLEQRVRELESELASEQRRHSDLQKNYRKADRQVKDMHNQMEEDKKSQEHLQELLDRVNGKISMFKRQIEEAEEVGNMNLSKFRKVQSQLEESEARAEEAEAMVGKLRAMTRSASHVRPGQSPSMSAMRRRMNSNQE
ncbi:PREDICTED: myosin heavy chain, striated muscle-like isoform X2 [Priapulus caudatus]|nr:PREDICTED: myosin heavy chain, striated muscle-like isoform X2 [Priapulus caudatus]